MLYLSYFLYLDGSGVEQDHAEARELLQKAVAKGHSGAQELLRKLGSQ